MNLVHRIWSRPSLLLLSLACLTCWQAKGDLLAGPEKEKNPPVVTYDASVLRVAFAEVIKKMPKDIAMRTFTELIEEKIAPAKLDDYASDINWGIGDFRLCSKKIPNCKIILSGKLVADPKQQGVTKIIIRTAEFKEAVPDADGKLSFKTVGSTWDHGKLVEDP